MVRARARAGESVRFSSFAFLFSATVVISTSPPSCLSWASTCDPVRATCCILSTLGSGWENPLPGFWMTSDIGLACLYQVSRQCHNFLIVWLDSMAENPPTGVWLTRPIQVFGAVASQLLVPSIHGPAATSRVGLPTILPGYHGDAVATSVPGVLVCCGSASHAQVGASASSEGETLLASFTHRTSEVFLSCFILETRDPRHWESYFLLREIVDKDPSPFPLIVLAASSASVFVTRRNPVTPSTLPETSRRSLHPYV